MTREPDQEGRPAPDNDSLINSEWALPYSAQAGFAFQSDQAGADTPPPSPAPNTPSFKSLRLPLLAFLWTGGAFGLYGLQLGSLVSGLIIWAFGLVLAALLLHDFKIETAGRNLTLKKIKERADQMEQRVDKRTASLHLRQRQLQALIDNTPPGAYIKNIHHEFILVNSRLCALLDAPMERLLGSKGLDFIQPDLARKITELERRVLNEKRSLEIPDLFDRARQPDGRIFSLTIFPVIGPDGDLEGSGGLLKETTRQLSQERELTRARAEAQKGAQAKSSFLANVSHEFRTPLNGIIGTADLLARSELSPDQAAMTAVIKNAGDALLAALNDVLDLSRIENGKLQLEARPFSLRELIFEALKGLAPIARCKNLELIINVAPQLPDQFQGDSLRLRQILLNLVSNALKFTQKGQVCLTLSSLETGEPPLPAQGPAYGPESGPFPNCRFRLSVSDTGIGIPEDKQKLIFEAFEQVDSSSTRSYGGAGLGLAISSHLAALMNSRLKLSSAEGRGSTFWLDLEMPVISGTAPGRAPKASEGGGERDLWEHVDLASLAAGLSAEATLVSSRRLRILLAEDMEVNQIVARRMLEELGHQVTVAASGAEALSMFRENSFDLILMDIQMPVMDGLTAAARIRELEIEQRRPHTPVAAMTAHALQGDRERYLARGLDDYQSKPLLISELAKMIEEMIEHWNIEGAPDDAPTVKASPQADPPPERPDSLSGVRPLRDPEAVETGRRHIIDFEVTKLSFGTNKQLLRKSMELYLRDAPLVMDRISAALEGDQPGETATQAHALKGISSYYTKVGPYLLALELDKRSRQADWPLERPDLMRLAAELRSAVETLMAEMRSYLSYED